VAALHRAVAGAPGLAQLVPVRKDSVRALFDRLDVDGDLYVSREELRSALRRGLLSQATPQTVPPAAAERIIAQRAARGELVLALSAPRCGLSCSQGEQMGGGR